MAAERKLNSPATRQSRLSAAVLLHVYPTGELDGAAILPIAFTQEAASALPIFIMEPEAAGMLPIAFMQEAAPAPLIFIMLQFLAPV